MAKTPTINKPVATPVDKATAAKAVKQSAYNPIGNLGTFAHPSKKKTKTK